jgi:hypothetical protein
MDRRSMDGLYVALETVPEQHLRAVWDGHNVKYPENAL